MIGGIRLDNKKQKVKERGEQSYEIDGLLFGVNELIEKVIEIDGGSREMSIVRTKIDEAMMWNIEYIQQSLRLKHPLDSDLNKRDKQIT